MAKIANFFLILIGRTFLFLIAFLMALYSVLVSISGDSLGLPGELDTPDWVKKLHGKCYPKAKPQTQEKR